MDKAKIAFLAVAGVALAAAVALGVLAYNKFGAASEAVQERSSKSSELDSIYRREIFPNAENVETMNGVQAEYEETLAAFKEELAKTNVSKPDDSEKMSPSAFQSKLSDTVKALLKMAPRVNGKSAVAEGFAFGFDAYVGKGTMPEQDEVPELVQHLMLTLMLVREAYGAQIMQLTKIERDAHDKATLALRQGSDRRREPEPEPEPEPQGRRRKRRAQVEEAQEEPLFVGQPMVLEFTARQESLIDLLNRLTGLKRPFVVVKSVSAKKVGADLRQPPALEAENSRRAEREREREREEARSERANRRNREGREGREGRERRVPRAESAAPEAPAPEKMPPELRVVSGPDLDPPLSVRLELEIFNFKAEEKAEVEAE